MEMTPETIRALLDAFESSDWREMTVTFGSDRLHVSRDAQNNGAPSEASAPVIRQEADAAAPAPAAAADSLPPPAVPASPEGTVIASPSVGLFWRAPSPTAPPFVEVGARVEAGDTIAIVEVMKLMNHVKAGCAGVVSAIHAQNGEMVEYGEPLITIAPE